MRFLFIFFLLASCNYPINMNRFNYKPGECYAGSGSELSEIVKVGDFGVYYKQENSYVKTESVGYSSFDSFNRLSRVDCDLWRAVSNVKRAELEGVNKN